MRSHYSIIVSLVCALVAASQTFTIKSARDERFIHTTPATPERDVRLGDARDAGTLFIHPLPEKVGNVVKASIMNTHSSLNVGLRGAAKRGAQLVWSPDTRFEWHVKRIQDDKYVIYHQGPHANLFWRDSDTASGDIVLAVEEKKTEWEIQHKAVVHEREL